MQAELHSPRDFRYQCLVTVLAILLFLPQLLLMGFTSRLLSAFADMGMALPSITNLLIAHPLLTLLFFVGLMISTIFFAWCNRKGAIIASLSLLLQGISLLMQVIACMLPSFQVLNALGTQ
jgi:hypothetical protein